MEDKEFQVVSGEENEEDARDQGIGTGRKRKASTDVERQNKRFHSEQENTALEV